MTTITQAQHTALFSFVQTAVQWCVPFLPSLFGFSVDSEEAFCSDWSTVWNTAPCLFIVKLGLVSALQFSLPASYWTSLLPWKPSTLPFRGQILMTCERPQLCFSLLKIDLSFKWCFFYLFVGGWSHTKNPSGLSEEEKCESLVFVIVCIPCSVAYYAALDISCCRW